MNDPLYDNLYNKQYLKKYIGLSNTPLGKLIMQARWNLIKSFCNRGSLIDYGCGSGAFIKLAPDSFDVNGWDINPYSRYSKHSPIGHYNILTMWDVIEHLPSPLFPLVEYTPNFIFVVTPNADNTSFEKFNTWKHYKPLEHLNYYTLKTLSMSMLSMGYKYIHHDFNEGELRDPSNREAILTAVFTK